MALLLALGAAAQILITAGFFFARVDFRSGGNRELHQAS